MRTYKLRSHRGPDDQFLAGVLTVPAEVVRILPDGIEFTCELTEEGILYRPVEPEPERRGVPSWATRPKP